MTEGSALYDVFLVRCGGDSNEATGQLVAVFGVSHEQAAALMQQLPARVKHKVSQETAVQVQLALVGIGAEVTIKEVPNSSGVERPSADSLAQVPDSSDSSESGGGTLLGGLAAAFRGRVVVIVSAVVVLLGVIWWLRSSGMGGLEVRRLAQGAGKPALVLLHGYGAPGHDLVGLGEEAVGSLPGMQVVVPEAPYRAGAGRAWWTDDIEQAPESRAAVMSLLDELVQEGTAPEEIVLAGFSQGAILAMDVGLHYQHDLGAIGMLSGQKQADLGWKELLAERTSMKIFVAHGRSDRILSFRAAKNFATELERNEHEVIFVEFRGAHEIPAEVREALFEYIAESLDL